MTVPTSFVVNPACNTSLIFYPTGTVLAEVRPHFAATIAISFVIVIVCVVAFVTQKPYYDRLRIRPMLLVMLSATAIVAQITAGPVASLSPLIFSNFPCWIRLVLFVMIPTFLGASMVIRMMLFHFLSNLSRLAARRQRDLVQLENKQVSACKFVFIGLKVGFGSFFRQMDDGQETLIALRFLISYSGQLVIVAVTSTPFLVLAMIIILITREYTAGCNGCRTFPQVFIPLAASAGAYVIMGLIVYLRIRNQLDYWGFSREILYSIICILVAVLGFILSFVVNDNLEVLQTLAFTFSLIPQTIYPIYLASKMEGKRKVRMPKEKVDSKASSHAGSSVLVANSVSLTLQQVLDDAELLQAFEDHLVSELAIESLLFIKAVNEWKQEYKEVTPEVRADTAKKICKTFITPGSVLEINVGSEMRDTMISTVHESEVVPSTVFDLGVRDLTFLLQTGPLIRFANSNGYVSSRKPSKESKVSVAATELSTGTGL